MRGRPAEPDHAQLQEEGGERAEGCVRTGLVGIASIVIIDSYLPCMISSCLPFDIHPPRWPEARRLDPGPPSGI